jgi:hypothetical protein
MKNLILPAALSLLIPACTTPPPANPRHDRSSPMARRNLQASGCRATGQIHEYSSLLEMFGRLTS